MDEIIREKALEKLAFYGPAGVAGAPFHMPPPPTVGQAMYSLYDPRLGLTPAEQRSIHDSIVNTGLPVNRPANSLLGAGIGALAGNFIANTLGTGPFMRGVLTGVGANYGYNRQ